MQPLSVPPPPDGAPIRKLARCATTNVLTGFPDECPTAEPRAMPALSPAAAADSGFSARFKLMEVIGSGSFGTVRGAQSGATAAPSFKAGSALTVFAERRSTGRLMPQAAAPWLLRW